VRGPTIKFSSTQGLQCNLQQARGLICKFHGNAIFLELFSNGKIYGPGPLHHGLVVQPRSMVERRRSGEDARWLFVGARCLIVQGHRCSPAIAGVDEEDSSWPMVSSLEHERRW
jgi:hypothetical protein